MANEIGDATTVIVPAPGTVGPGYAVTINSAIEELQARVAQRADNGSIAQMPTGTVKANLTGVLADAQDVTLAALAAALGVGGGGGGYPVIVEDIGVATGNTGAANELALRTHMNAGLSTPYSYQFGPGTYNFDKNALAGDQGRGSIYVKDTMATRRFSGQGRGVTTLAYGGLGNSGEWNLFYVVGGSSALFEVSDMDLHCTGITNPDAGNQHHLINVAAVSTHGTGKIRENIRVSRTNFRTCIGSGFRTLGEPLVGNYVQGYAVTDCDFATAGIGFGSRSCLELQRGSRLGLYANITAKGARNSVFDSEITSGGSADDLVFHNCLFDGVTANSNNVFSVGGSSAPGSYRANNWILSNVVTRCGYVGIYYANNVRFTNCRFEYTPGVNIAVDTLMNDGAGATPLVTVRGENDLLNFTDCVWYRGVGVTTPGSLFDVQALAGPTQRSFRVSLTSPTFTDASVTPSSAVVIASDVNDFNVNNMTVVSGATTNFDNAADCLRWKSDTATTCASLRIDGLRVRTAGGLMRQLINVSAAAGITLGTVDVIGVDGTGVINPANTSSSIIGFDTSTGILNENPLLLDLRSPGQYTWIAANAAATMVFPIVSGGRGARTTKTLESYVTAPNTFALGAPGDMFLYRPTAQTFELWIKRTQTSSAILTQDRNGWVLLTSSTSGSIPLLGTATLTVSRSNKRHVVIGSITDVRLTVSNRLLLNWAPTTEASENTPETSSVFFVPAIPTAGSCAVKIVSLNNLPPSGNYDVTYAII